MSGEFLRPTAVGNYDNLSVAATVRSLHAGDIDISTLPVDEMRAFHKQRNPKAFFTLWAGGEFKLFRNGMAGIALEERWEQITSLTQTGTLYEADETFELIPQALDEQDTSEERMNRAARSIKGVINHVLVHTLRPDTVIGVQSPDDRYNNQCNELFKEACAMARELGLFNMEVPESTDSRAHYIARGTRGLQVNVFQLPGLISRLAQRDLGTMLTVDQHRNAYRTTVQKVVMQYLKPTAQHALMIDVDTHDGDDNLRIDGYDTAGDADSFMVFPTSRIVAKHTESVNSMLANGAFIAPATGCPVKSGGLIKKMTDLAFDAAEQHFYPQYSREVQG